MKQDFYCPVTRVCVPAAPPTSIHNMEHATIVSVENQMWAVSTVRMVGQISQMTIVC